MTATALAFTSAGTTLALYGDAGTDILASDVAASLKSAGGKSITINLFSYGGDAGTGLAIYDQLARYSGRVTVVIDGVAASAGSLIAMAADHLIMPDNALIMIHNCWAMSAGDAATMRTSADLLDTYSQVYCQTYATKSGASLEQVGAWMAAGAGAGTWFTAAEALAAGLADEVAPAAAIRAAAPRLPADRFSNPPALLAQWSAPHPLPPSLPMTAQNIESNIEASTAELRRENDIRRCAAQAHLSPEAIEGMVASGKPFAEVAMEIVTAHAQVIEGRTSAGHPARIHTGSSEPQGLEAALTRAIRGERLEEPLWLSLRAAGLGHGNDAGEVWRSALAREGRWLARGAGSLSTSDLPNLLTATGNRRLMERFQVAESGVRLAASVRQLQDYRAASVIDVGTVGTAKEILEGGEVQFGSVDEAAASYRPKRFGIGLSFTPVALANDDLAGLDAALSELAAAMLDAEAVALVDLLEGAALGRNAPDGKALFHADHANVVTGGVSLTTIGTAVQKLRDQKAIGGRYIDQAPAAILCGSASENLVLQLLSDAVNAAQSSDVNPWRNLEIAVDPRLSGSFAYVLANGRRPLELGRLSDAPVLTTEVEFSTDAYRAKSVHSFGAIVQEHRSIVRIATA